MHHKDCSSSRTRKRFLVSRQLLGFDVDRFKTSGRLYGEDKAKRDMFVFMLSEGGAFANAEIGGIFDVS